jgi:hypothetical protein
MYTFPCHCSYNLSENRLTSPRNLHEIAHEHSTMIGGWGYYPPSPLTHTRTQSLWLCLNSYYVGMNIHSTHAARANQGPTEIAY